MTYKRQRIGTPSAVVDTSRLEMFADGIFGIAATLLIVRVSVDAPSGALGKALLHAWPQYVAYAVSFLMIGIWWVNHHAFLKVIERVDRTFLFANIALLGCVAFIPFPTGLVAKHFHDDGLQAAVITYGLTLTATAFCMSFLWFYASIGRRLIVETTEQSTLDSISRYVAPGPVGTGVGDAHRDLEPVHDARSHCGICAVLRIRGITHEGFRFLKMPSATLRYGADHDGYPRTFNV